MDIPKNAPITIADIAEALDLSKSTVSRVLSGTGRIGADTRKRVLEYSRECGYKPNLIAKGLAVSKTFNIGVVIPGDAVQTDMPYFQTCLAGITEYASSQNYDVLLTMVNGNTTEGVERILNNRKVDGIILTRLLEDDVRVNLIRSSTVPFVVVGSTLDPEIFQVDTDNEKACKEFTKSLVSNDKRYIFLCGKQDILVNRARLSGFLAAMKELEVGKENYQIYKNVCSNMGVFDNLAKEKSLEGTCIICGDDILCSGALDFLQRKNYKIPTDVEVASFYNSTLLNQYIPAISAININAHKIGYKSCELLLNVIKGCDCSTKNVVEHDFLYRDSTLN